MKGETMARRSATPGQVDMFNGKPRQLVPGADICAGYHRGAATSVEARQSLPDEHLKGERARVTAAVRAAGPGGITCDQLEILLGTSHQSTSARVCELSRLGLIHHTLAKAPTRSGRNAWLYFDGPASEPAPGTT